MVWARSSSHVLKPDSKRWITLYFLQVKVEIVNTLPHHIVGIDANWPTYSLHNHSAFGTQHPNPPFVYHKPTIPRYRASPPKEQDIVSQIELINDETFILFGLFWGVVFYAVT